MQAFLVGQIRFYSHECREREVVHFPTWEFQGVFVTEEEARAACRNERYFVWPFELGAECPDETGVMTGAFWPKDEGECAAASAAQS